MTGFNLEQHTAHSTHLIAEFYSLSKKIVVKNIDLMHRVNKNLEGDPRFPLGPLSAARRSSDLLLCRLETLHCQTQPLCK
jgi:hypothetical protein